jgi:1-acyl-sn-glycerol-3-phosphate acyltransferase
MPFLLIMIGVGMLKIKYKAKKYTINRHYYPFSHRLHLFAKIIRSLLFIFRIKIKYIGFDNLPTKPMLIVANHKSNVDPLALVLILDKVSRKNNLNLSFSILSKNEVKSKKKNGFFSSALSLLDVITFDRTNLREQIEVINKENIAIQEKRSIIIFIEGTRVYEDEFGEFKAGGFRIAYQNYLPILPVVVCGSSGLLDKNKTYVNKKREIIFCALPCIKPAKFIDIDTNTFSNNLRSVMQKKYYELKIKR